MGLAIPNPLAHSADVRAKQVGRKAVSLHPECFAYRIKSGLRVFGFCPAGATSKVDLTCRLRSDQPLRVGHKGSPNAKDLHRSIGSNRLNQKCAD
jgi:hypothetical protein